VSHKKDIDILAVAGIDVDLVLKVPELPSHDEKVIGQMVGWLPGGPAANFACAASRLGLRVSSLSNVGDDEGGQLIIDDFQRYGVDTSLMQVRHQAESPFTVILIDPTGEKAIVVVPTLNNQFSPELVASVMPRTRFMYIMPQEHELFFTLAQQAHRHGAEVAIDVEPTVGAQRQKLEQILAHTDIASFNQDGFTAATGQPPTIAAARALLDLGPHTVVVTRGAAGSLVVTPTEAAEAPGFKVSVADTTGAGDTFNAAFLTATLQNKPLAERLRFANAAAAISVTVVGPRGKLPTVEEIERFLEENE